MILKKCFQADKLSYSDIALHDYPSGNFIMKLNVKD